MNPVTSHSLFTPFLRRVPLAKLASIYCTYPVTHRMGLKAGDLVLEIGRGADSDDSLRIAVEAITGTALIEDETEEVVDSVLIWWRDGDGDLENELVDTLTYLTQEGSIWLLTPKAGRDGHVEPSDIQDAAPNVGLSQTSTMSIASDWGATHLVARRAGKR